MAPRAVLMKIGLKSVNTARPVNTVRSVNTGRPFSTARHQELTSPEQTATGKDFSNPLIVDSLLKTIWLSMHHVFTMKHWLVQSKRLLHNMAAFLEKSTGSEGFHQVIDFLSQSHISYALTKKPEIYISFIKQFWITAEASTDTNGELEDHNGITSIPISEIFEQLALMGYPTDSDNPKKTAWEQFSRVEIGLFLTMLPSPMPESSPTPSSSPSRITSSPSLLSEPSTEPTFEPQPLPDAEYHVPSPNESPLHAVHSYESYEGSLKLNELKILVINLSKRIGVLEDDLKKTKQSYSCHSLISIFHMGVKKLES
ncbi:hypothetical protein Tco_0433016 [Tanacetum coccineum]